MKKTFLLIILVMAYIILINVLSGINLKEILKEEIGGFIQEGNSEIVKVGISDSVSVSIYRPQISLCSKKRCYLRLPKIFGSIYESDGNSKLYLFYFLPLPLKSNGINFIYFHILFLIVIIYLALKKNKKQNIKQEIIEEYNIY